MVYMGPLRIHLSNPRGTFITDNHLFDLLHLLLVCQLKLYALIMQLMRDDVCVCKFYYDTN